MQIAGQTPVIRTCNRTTPARRRSHGQPLRRDREPQCQEDAVGELDAAGLGEDGDQVGAPGSVEHAADGSLREQDGDQREGAGGAGPPLNRWFTRYV